jgi:hypothetical protein
LHHRRIGNKDIKPSAVLLEPVCKSLHGREFREVHDPQLRGLAPSFFLYLFFFEKRISTPQFQVSVVVLTLQRGLPLALAPARENKAPRVHRREMLRSFEAKADIRADGDDGFSCEVDFLDRGTLGALASDEAEESELAHACKYERWN